jgi:hypothetical protein
MNSTTGAEATALSIAERTSVDRKDFCRAAKRGERRGLRRGRSVWEATCGFVRGAWAIDVKGCGVLIRLSGRTCWRRS